MFKILPHFNTERLTLALRRKCGLNRLDSRMMHVVREEAINAPERLGRYNIRQFDGSIRKVTLYENYMREQILKNNGNGYQVVSSHRVNF